MCTYFFFHYTSVVFNLNIEQKALSGYKIDKTRTLTRFIFQYSRVVSAIHELVLIIY